MQKGGWGCPQGNPGGSWFASRPPQPSRPTWWVNRLLSPAAALRIWRMRACGLERQPGHSGFVARMKRSADVLRKPAMHNVHNAKQAILSLTAFLVDGYALHGRQVVSECVMHRRPIPPLVVTLG